MAAVSRTSSNALVMVLDDAVNDRSLVMTSSYTNMIVFGQCLAHAWSLEEYGDILEGLIAAGEDLLPRAADLAERTARLLLPRICFVGSGTLAGAAQESALKVLEMTAGGVKSSHESVLGLRHGPMAALDSETLFVALVSGDEARAGYAFDLLAEIGQKQIVRQRIVVGPAFAQARFADVSDTFLPLAVHCDDAYRPILDVIFGQLLGLYCSIAHNLKPDAPSADSVINRVVAKFALY
jgi:tagatose-6-phosphate ketose/aldose isomerase